MQPAVTLAEAIDHVAAIIATHSFPDEVTGAHWRLDLDVPEELEPIRSCVIVYTIDGARYEVTRANGALQAKCDDLPFTHSPEWDRGYESGFADGANDQQRINSEDTAALIEAARDSLADAAGYAATLGAGTAATKRVRARCDRLRAALAAMAEA